jgi:hypothetical protein
MVSRLARSSGRSLSLDQVAIYPRGVFACGNTVIGADSVRNAAPHSSVWRTFGFDVFLFSSPSAARRRPVPECEALRGIS